MKISCVIITKNEEKNIGDCLESLQIVADEIIILDSFSDDKTEEICKKYNTTFIKVDWQGYAATKNSGNSLANFPYILSIDADERLSEKLQRDILRVKALTNPADAYEMNRLTNYCGKWIRHCGWYPDRKIRIWKKEIAEWRGEIHESLELKESSIIKPLKGDLLHYSYYNIDDHRRQIERYTTLMAEESLKRNKSVPLIKLILSPVLKFLTMYIFRLGFLDGTSGLKVCLFSSYANYLKYKKSRMLQKEKSN